MIWVIFNLYNNLDNIAIYWTTLKVFVSTKTTEVCTFFWKHRSCPTTSGFFHFRLRIVVVTNLLLIEARTKRILEVSRGSLVARESRRRKSNKTEMHFQFPSATRENCSCSPPPHWVRLGSIYTHIRLYSFLFFYVF